VQTAQLHIEKKPEAETGKVVTEEVLFLVPQSHGAQGNQD
jgi:hypothetical protein